MGCAGQDGVRMDNEEGLAQRGKKTKKELIGEEEGASKF